MQKCAAFFWRWEVVRALSIAPASTPPTFHDETLAVPDPRRVAPAEAGAYPASRSRPTDVMGPSLRWGDGSFGAGTLVWLQGGVGGATRARFAQNA